MNGIGIGIDLGTSQSAGCFQSGKDEKSKEKYLEVFNELVRSNTISRVGNEKSHPSYVQYDKNGKVIVVGIRAKSLASISPKTTVYDSKRLIGRKFNDKEVQKLKKILDERGHFEICADDKGEAAIKIGEIIISPEEVASEIIFDVLKDAFQTKSDLMIDNMVISVPAYFTEIQKLKTKQAAILAIKNLKNTEYSKRINIDIVDKRPEDIKDIELISEPSAALITYMAKSSIKEIPKDKYILVFDMGAGTLDISIGTASKLKNPRGGGEYMLNVKTTHGDTALGGRDMDQKIIEWIKPELQKKNIPIDNKIEVNLLDKVEKAKIILSSKEKTVIRLLDEDVEVTVERSKLEEIIFPILQRSREIIKEAMKKAEAKKGDVAAIVMVGGPTYMQSVRRIVEEEVGIKIGDFSGWDSMLCVAEGAARHGKGEGIIEEPIPFDYYIAPVMFHHEEMGINVGTKIASCGDRANVNRISEIFVPLYVPTKESEGFGVIKLCMVRKIGENSTCIQEISVSVASHFLDRSDEHCQVKRSKYSGKVLNGDFPFGYEKIKINFRINGEGLLMKPEFIQNRNENKIIYPDIPVENKYGIGLVDWPTFFGRDWDKHAREFLSRIDDYLYKNPTAVGPVDFTSDELKVMAKGKIVEANRLPQSERLKDLIGQLDKAIIDANNTPSKKANLAGAIIALQTYIEMKNK